MIEFEVLGPLRVCRHGVPVVLGAAMQRRLLAVLLCRAGEAVAVPTLIDAIWAGMPPQTARKTLQVYVRRLRQALGEDQRVRHGPAGYAVVVEPGELDAARFTDLADQARAARRAGDLETAGSRYRQALRLWRGAPYADLADVPFVVDEVQRLAEQRLLTLEDRVAVDLDVGRHAELVGELAGLVNSHPYRERLRAYLMLALHRAGRQAEALDTYRKGRSRLVEELGVEPEPALQLLHEAILRNDARLSRLSSAGVATLPSAMDPAARAEPAARAALSEPAAPAAPVPAQLPTDVAGFTGRSVELAALDALLRTDPDRPATAVVISAIAGTAGVGKTALAVHWAHRVRGAFPDGQLYVNLRGYDPSGTPVSPAEALRGFLDTFNVPTARIPDGLQAQVGLYRSLLSTRRVLVVLDNARDPEQVRPLLPASPGCLVLVTSRDQLSGLVAAQGAHLLAVDLLSADEAYGLLVRRLGAARVTAEPDAVHEIIGACARLPLALTIVAARATTNPILPLAALAAQLQNSRDRLDALTTGEQTTDVQAVFSWSYDALSPAAARLFRLLGLHPGPDIAAPTAASLAGIAPDQIRPHLAELVHAHLIVERGQGRYTFHDLLRVYARQLASTADTEEERRAAIHRILDHYLHTAGMAAKLVHPAREAVNPDPPRSGVTLENLADHAQAQAWLNAEHTVLRAAIDTAAGAGFDTHVWQLAWNLRTFLHRRALWQDRLATGRAAMAAARRLRDPLAQARAHRLLARAHMGFGRMETGNAHYRRALDLHRQAGDVTGQAHTHLAIAVMFQWQSRPADALRHAEQAVELFHTAGHHGGHANALHSESIFHGHLGNHQLSLARCRRAIALLQAVGDRDGEAGAWETLGYAQHHLGNHAEAMACYRRSIGMYRELGEPYMEAETLTHLGDRHHDTGDRQAARDAWQQAVAILTALNHPDADTVRTKLDQMDGGPASGRRRRAGGGRPTDPKTGPVLRPTGP